MALVAVSSTLFLFLHTRDLSSKLKQMEVRLQPEDALVTGNQMSGTCCHYACWHRSKCPPCVFPLLSKIYNFSMKKQSF